MDRRSFRSASCNGSSRSLAPASPAAAGSRAPSPAASASAAAAGSKEDAAGASERKALLPRRPPGGMARKGSQKASSKRRVQWKDSHGKKLVEVLEFQPSDSSDSDDEYLDTCICTIM